MVPLGRDLIGLKPDVLVAGSMSGALAAQAATQTIPTVIITPDDPVASGFARSIARPSGNITGMWFDYDALVDKRLEFLKLAVPPVARVGVIVNLDDPTDAVSIRRLTAATGALGMTLEQFEVRDVTKLDVMAATIGRAGVEALLIGDGPTILSARTDIIAMVARLDCRLCMGFANLQTPAV